jgi:hypothetical protein
MTFSPNSLLLNWILWSPLKIALLLDKTSKECILLVSSFFSLMHHRPPSFFDRENQLFQIYELNGFFPKLKSLIDFEMFRTDLQKVREKKRLSNASRKPFDVVLMFKILVLKALYNLSDEKTEEKIRDSLSWHDFLDLHASDFVPDAKTMGAKNLTQCPSTQRLRLGARFV